MYNIPSVWLTRSTTPLCRFKKCCSLCVNYWFPSFELEVHSWSHPAFASPPLCTFWFNTWGGPWNADWKMVDPKNSCYLLPTACALLGTCITRWRVWQRVCMAASSFKRPIRSCPAKRLKWRRVRCVMSPELFSHLPDWTDPRARNPTSARAPRNPAHSNTGRRELVKFVSLQVAIKIAVTIQDLK